MPFRFTWICDLLQEIEDIECRDPPHLPDRKRAFIRATVERWFRRRRKDLDRPDTDGAAILSTLFPHARTDRVYGIKDSRLEKLVARCLNYRTDKIRQLGAWRLPGRGDLGERLESIERIHDSEPLPRGHPLTVEDVDFALHDIASRVRFSSPAVQKSVSADLPQDILAHILLRIHSRDKKWFIRLFLKDFGRVVLDQKLVLGEFHFLLPPLLNFQNDFAAAMALLKGPLSRYHAKPDPFSQKLMLEQAAQYLKPKIGVKIGRPTWYKARSMQNCLQMVGRGTWIIERKYDGEFCEIHVDLDKEDPIQIFSKNGKDATRDRKDLLPAIRSSLRLNTSECRFRSKCILLGEMVVYNQLERAVMDFDKIRKHVSRSGSFLGTAKDSQSHSYENLMIFYFDILLVDDEVTMALPHAKRRKRLSEIITKIDGRAKTAEWKLLDFSERMSTKSLIYQFCEALTHVCEGLILKPNGPYFFLLGDETDSWCRGFIKLKKDYMTDLGGSRDQADFAIVAASYDVHVAQKCQQKSLKFTNFYLGCLADNNPYQKRRTFRVVAIVTGSHCIPPKELEYLNQVGQFRCKEFDEDDPLPQFAIQFGSNPLPSVVFPDPIVVEVLGSSFEKPPNEDFHMLRHPRILRTHMDRSWEDCITMQGLAQIAREAREEPPDDESQKLRDMVQYYMSKVSRSRDDSSLDSRRTSTTTQSSRTSSTPLATLKDVGRSRNPSTPIPPTFCEQARETQHSISSMISVKTPSPATALNKFKNTAEFSMVAVDFGKEATPVSQQSTQWTETIISPPISARHSTLRHLTTISPPRRRMAVPYATTTFTTEVNAGNRPRVLADHNGSPDQNGSSSTHLKPPQAISLRNTAEKHPVKAQPGSCDSDETLVGNDDSEQEISFYAEREAISLQQYRLAGTNSKENLRRGREISKNGAQSPMHPPRGILGSWPLRNPARFRLGSSMKTSVPELTPQQRRDAEDIISRQRTLKMTVSTASSMEPEKQSNSRPESAEASAFMLPPITMLSTNFMPTPPTSSPNEPVSKKKGMAVTSTAPPASPPSSSTYPTTAISPYKCDDEAIPSHPERTSTTEQAATATITPPPARGLKRPATGSVDDFAIGATPRKLPKWRSSVYSRPLLPKSPSKDDAKDTRVAINPSPPQSNQRSTVKMTTTTFTSNTSHPTPSLFNLPYDLAQTVIYLSPSLQQHRNPNHPLHRILSQHYAPHAPLVIDDLAHWRRGDSAIQYESQGSIVGESQAYAGYERAVLVEPAEKEECQGVLRRLEGLVEVDVGKRRDGKVGVLVGMFDWRVLEELVDVGSDERERGVWARRLWGCVRGS